MSWPAASAETSRYPEGLDPNFAGAADDPTLGRGKGPPFLLGWDTAPASAENKILTFQFIDWIRISAGRVRWTGANPGDEISVRVHAPASPQPVPNGTNTGNCNVVDLGSGALLIVAANGNGSHDIDLTNAVPVGPVDDGSWNWSTPDTGLGTITPDYTGNGKYNLLNFQKDLVEWVTRLQIFGADGSAPLEPATPSRMILPHWRCVATLHNEGVSGPFYAGWTFSMARKQTI